ncbi:MAG: hypothetical protein ACYTDX_11745, partial [Planctomycetota bacterium]
MSKDVGDRTAVESAYREGDKAQREALLKKALENPSQAPLDLLRLAVFGLDADMAKLARKALAASDTPGAIGLIVDAMRVPMAPAERDALIEALARLGRASPKARWLAVVHTGLASSAGAVDIREWKSAGAKYEAPDRRDLDELESTLASTSEEEPQDAAVLTELAESYLARAMSARNSGNALMRDARIFARLGFEDARRMALQAEERGGAGWRTDTVLALSAYYSGDADGAYPRAEAAVKALPAGEGSWNSYAVLTVFAEGRWKAIKKAVNAKEDWPPEWLTDLHSAYGVLRDHPHGTDAQVLWHYRLLSWLGSPAQAIRVLE